MYTIWKFELEIQDTQIVEMPSQAEFLHVAVQRDKLCLWVRCNTDNPIVKQEINIRGTGHNADSVGVHIGSVLMFGDSLVWHVFNGRFNV